MSRPDSSKQPDQGLPIIAKEDETAEIQPAPPLPPKITVIESPTTAMTAAERTPNTVRRTDDVEISDKKFAKDIVNKILGEDSDKNDVTKIVIINIDDFVKITQKPSLFKKGKVDFFHKELFDEVIANLKSRGITPYFVAKKEHISLFDGLEVIDKDELDKNDSKLRNQILKTAQLPKECKLYYFGNDYERFKNIKITYNRGTEVRKEVEIAKHDELEKLNNCIQQDGGIKKDDSRLNKFLYNLKTSPTLVNRALKIKVKAYDDNNNPNDLATKFVSNINFQENTTVVLNFDDIVDRFRVKKGFLRYKTQPVYKQNELLHGILQEFQNKKITVIIAVNDKKSLTDANEIILLLSPLHKNLQGKAKIKSKAFGEKGKKVYYIGSDFKDLEEKHGSNIRNAQLCALISESLEDNGGLTIEALKSFSNAKGLDSNTLEPRTPQHKTTTPILPPPTAFRSEKEQREFLEREMFKTEGKPQEIIIDGVTYSLNLQNGELQKTGDGTKIASQSNVDDVIIKFLIVKNILSQLAPQTATKAVVNNKNEEFVGFDEKKMEITYKESKSDDLTTIFGDAKVENVRKTLKLLNDDGEIIQDNLGAFINWCSVLSEQNVVRQSVVVEPSLPPEPTNLQPQPSAPIKDDSKASGAEGSDLTKKIINLRTIKQVDTIVVNIDDYVVKKEDASYLQKLKDAGINKDAGIKLVLLSNKFTFNNLKFTKVKNYSEIKDAARVLYIGKTDQKDPKIANNDEIKKICQNEDSLENIINKAISLVRQPFQEDLGELWNKAEILGITTNEEFANNNGDAFIVRVKVTDAGKKENYYYKVVGEDGGEIEIKDGLLEQFTERATFAYRFRHAKGILEKSKIDLENLDMALTNEGTSLVFKDSSGNKYTLTQQGQCIVTAIDRRKKLDYYGISEIINEHCHNILEINQFLGKQENLKLVLNHFESKQSNPGKISILESGQKKHFSSTELLQILRGLEATQKSAPAMLLPQRQIPDAKTPQPTDTIPAPSAFRTFVPKAASIRGAIINNLVLEAQAKGGKLYFHLDNISDTKGKLHDEGLFRDLLAKGVTLVVEYTSAKTSDATSSIIYDGLIDNLFKDIPEAKSKIKKHPITNGPKKIIISLQNPNLPFVRQKIEALIEKQGDSFEIKGTDFVYKLNDEGEFIEESGAEDELNSVVNDICKTLAFQTPAAYKPVTGRIIFTRDDNSTILSSTERLTKVRETPTSPTLEQRRRVRIVTPTSPSMPTAREVTGNPPAQDSGEEYPLTSTPLRQLEGRKRRVIADPETPPETGNSANESGLEPLLATPESNVIRTSREEDQSAEPLLRSDLGPNNSEIIFNQEEELTQVGELGAPPTSPMVHLNQNLQQTLDKPKPSSISQPFDVRHVTPVVTIVKPGEKTPKNNLIQETSFNTPSAASREKSSEQKTSFSPRKLVQNSGPTLESDTESQPTQSVLDTKPFDVRHVTPVVELPKPGEKTPKNSLIQETSFNTPSAASREKSSEQKTSFSPRKLFLQNSGQIPNSGPTLESDTESQPTQSVLDSDIVIIDIDKYYGRESKNRVIRGLKSFVGLFGIKMHPDNFEIDRNLLQYLTEKGKKVILVCHNKTAAVHAIKGLNNVEVKTHSELRELLITDPKKTYREKKIFYYGAPEIDFPTILKGYLTIQKQEPLPFRKTLQAEEEAEKELKAVQKALRVAPLSTKAQTLADKIEEILEEKARKFTGTDLSQRKIIIINKQVTQKSEKLLKEIKTILGESFEFFEEDNEKTQGGVKIRINKELTALTLDDLSRTEADARSEISVDLENDPSIDDTIQKGKTVIPRENRIPNNGNLVTSHKSNPVITDDDLITILPSQANKDGKKITSQSQTTTITAGDSGARGSAAQEPAATVMEDDTITGTPAAQNAHNSSESNKPNSSKEYNNIDKPILVKLDASASDNKLITPKAAGLERLTQALNLGNNNPASNSSDLISLAAKGILTKAVAKAEAKAKAKANNSVREKYGNKEILKHGENFLYENPAYKDRLNFKNFSQIDFVLGESIDLKGIRRSTFSSCHFGPNCVFNADDFKNLSAMNFSECTFDKSLLDKFSFLKERLELKIDANGNWKSNKFILKKDPQKPSPSVSVLSKYQLADKENINSNEV